MAITLHIMAVHSEVSVVVSSTMVVIHAVCGAIRSPNVFKNYWWLRSPDTDGFYDGTVAWDVGSSGSTYDGVVSGVNFSYGCRRARIGTILLIMSTQMVLSTAAATTISVIPTGV